MPSLCLLCVAMLVRALSLWVTTIQQDGGDEETDKQASKNRNKSVKDKDSDTEEPGDQKVEEVKKEPKAKGKKKVDDLSMSVVNIGANYLLVHLIGYAVMNSPFILSYIGKRILIDSLRLYFLIDSAFTHLLSYYLF